MYLISDVPSQDIRETLFSLRNDVVHRLEHRNSDASARFRMQSAEQVLDMQPEEKLREMLQRVETVIAVYSETLLISKALKLEVNWK